MSGAEPCLECGYAYPQQQLSCPQCQTLRHSAELKRLSGVAKEQAAQGDVAKERATLQQMLGLLPSASVQYQRLQARLEQQPAAPSKNRWGRWGGVIVTLGLLLWKFKAVLVFLLGKGKLLLLGLTKAKTALSMLLALGAYWTLWGWQFALGFVLSIYVHEMGHVAALRRLGIRASAPMFIPFVGAFVRLKDYPKTPHDDAVVGLAGPIYGLGAALVCYGLYWLLEVPVLGGIAHAGAMINLFNLIPVWQLDGGRGFNALGTQQRWILTALIAAGWFYTKESFLILLLLGAGYRVLFTPPAPMPDRRAFFTYGALVVVLSGLAGIQLEELAAEHSAVATSASAQ
jgi:Zn-dependent protease